MRRSLSSRAVSRPDPGDPGQRKAAKGRGFRGYSRHRPSILVLWTAVPHYLTGLSVSPSSRSCPVGWRTLARQIRSAPDSAMDQSAAGGITGGYAGTIYILRTGSVGVIDMIRVVSLSLSLSLGWWYGVMAKTNTAAWTATAVGWDSWVGAPEPRPGEHSHKPTLGTRPEPAADRTRHGIRCRSRREGQRADRRPWPQQCSCGRRPARPSVDPTGCAAQKGLISRRRVHPPEEEEAEEDKEKAGGRSAEQQVSSGARSHGRGRGSSRLQNSRMARNRGFGTRVGRVHRWRSGCVLIRFGASRCFGLVALGLVTEVDWRWMDGGGAFSRSSRLPGGYTPGGCILRKPLRRDSRSTSCTD